MISCLAFISKKITSIALQLLNEVYLVLLAEKNDTSNKKQKGGCLKHFKAVLFLEIESKIYENNLLVVQNLKMALKKANI